MSSVSAILQPMYPWLFFLCLVAVFVKLFGWAKKKKTGALVFGIIAQMFMPDPFVERTVKVVQEDKKESKQSEEDSSELS